VAEDWIKRHVVKNKLRTRAEIERCLAKYVFSTWGKRTFTDIRRRDIAALLDTIEDEHGARQADLVLGHVRSIANWYAARNDDYLSPFTRAMQRVEKRARSRILSDPELRAVWKEAERSGQFGALIRMLLLTAQRKGAVLGMRWDNVSKDGVWEIRTAEREKGNAGMLQLPEPARAIVVAQPRFASNPYVFAASRGNGPMDGSASRAKKAFDKRCGVSGWTLHDLRRSSRSLMSRAGVRPDIAEKTLGHIAGGVEAIYDRHHFLEEKSEALAKVAALIGAIVNPPKGGNVVTMAKKRA
jgi:integrase